MLAPMVVPSVTTTLTPPRLSHVGQGRSGSLRAAKPAEHDSAPADRDCSAGTPGDNEPWFWSWLTNVEHTSFEKSLVFISVCLTSQNQNLRNAIGALNYLSFQNSVDAKLALAIELYLVKSLARPTRSPEEVYYNMERVRRTNMIIYKEDKLLGAC